MAHEINATDVFGEVRARGERAWHGLGVELPTGLGAWEAFQQIGLGWGGAAGGLNADHVRLVHNVLGLSWSDRAAPGYRRARHLLQSVLALAFKLCGDPLVPLLLLL